MPGLLAKAVRQIKSVLPQGGLYIDTSNIWRRVNEKRILSLLLILCMAVTLLPTAAFAEEATGETVPEGGAKIGDTVYADLDEALQAAQDNDTIYLGEGTYSSYKSTAVKGKNSR